MLGPRIAALRRNAHMSQAELARRIRVSPSAIGMYEQGRREPSAQTLVTLAQVFGVTTDFLLTGKPRMPPDEEALSSVMARVGGFAQERLNQRSCAGFSPQELAVLFAAMLMEP